jgi:CTP synthase (UTP-ammonia lyase)
LQELQEATSADQPRWNFEGWAMSVLPRAVGDQKPCPENATAVYRAYNNGYALGKDSNHRYATNPALLDAMHAEGWINEGIAFCSPNE